MYNAGLSADALLDRSRLAAVPAQAFVAKWLTSFKDFPPCMKPASFSLDQVMASMTSAAHQ